MKLSTWMHQNNRTNLELAYWFETYPLFCGTKSLALLVMEGGFGCNKARLVTVSQDLIGWNEFLHGKVSVKIESIQAIHSISTSSCRLTGKDWMKGFIFTAPPNFPLSVAIQELHLAQ